LSYRDVQAYSLDSPFESILPQQDVSHDDWLCDEDRTIEARGFVFKGQTGGRREIVCKAFRGYVADRIPSGVAGVLHGERLDVPRAEHIIVVPALGAVLIVGEVLRPRAIGESLAQQLKDGGVGAHTYHVTPA
jgi:hypothetical protein